MTRLTAHESNAHRRTSEEATDWWNTRGGWEKEKNSKFPQNSTKIWNWGLSICLIWDTASFIISCSLYQGSNAHHKRPQVLIKCNIYTLRMFNFLLSQHAGK